MQQQETACLTHSSTKANDHDKEIAMALAGTKKEGF
jgi:hypothetical protein